MATSGSTDFSVTRDNIIDDALSLTGVLGIDQTTNATDITFCARQLNMMIKNWGAQGIHLWKSKQAQILLQKDQNKYALGAGSTDHSSETVVETTADAAAASATAITVASTTGMTASDNIGIELTSGSLHWDTIASVDTSTTLTLTTGLASASTGTGNVYVYTTLLQRPLDIVQVRLKNDDDVERELTQLTRDEYFAYPSKSQTGTPTGWYYDTALTKGNLYIWPTPDDVGDRLLITFRATMEDFDSSTDTPDLPQEWYLAIVWNLAVHIAPAYGKIKTMTSLEPRAQFLLDQLRFWDTEKVDISILPAGSR